MVTDRGVGGRLREYFSRPRIKWFLLALVVYTVAMLVMLYPVPFRLASVLPGLDRPSSDYYQYTWWLWWTKQAVLGPASSLSHITLVNHPVGVDHPFTLTMIAVSLAGLPFSLLFSPAVTYNLQVLLSFVLAGGTMYWLATELTDSPKAGLVGGFIFAFFPNKMGHVLGGHLPQLTVHWFPLYVLFLWRALRCPTWRRSLLLALALVPTCLVHLMHLAYLVLPVTLVVLVLNWAEMKATFFSRERIIRLAAAFCLGALLVAPFLLPTILHSAWDSDYLSKTGAVKGSTDLLAFLTPSPHHPVLARLGLVPSFARKVFDSEGAVREGLAYPGILAVGLALVGCVRRRREVWAWALVAIAAALLSLGPLLNVGGEPVTYQVDEYNSYIVMPYALLQRLPLLQMGRTPGRLNETTMFAVAVLAAYGVAEWTRATVRRAATRLALMSLLLLGIGFEYVVEWPFPVGSAEIPATVEEIARDPGDGATLHVPMTRAVNHLSLYYQTATGKPVIGGKIHRVLPEVLPWKQTLQGLAQADEGPGDIVPRPDLASREAWLRFFEIDHVLVHTWEPDRGAVARGYVEVLLGPPVVEEDGVSAVFRVPNSVPPLDGPRLYSLGGGWYPLEDDGGIWRRWMGDEAHVHVYSLHEELGSIRVTLDSHLEVAVLDLYHGDRLLDSVVVGDRTAFTTRPFTLTAGMNVIRLVAREGCVPVVDDPRCWSDAMQSPAGAAPVLLCDPDALLTTCRSFVVDSFSFAPTADLRAGEGVEVRFGDQMRLRGWRLDADGLRPGGVLSLDLDWEYLVDPTDQYVVFVHVLADDGTLVAQHDEAPVGSRLAAWQWPPNTTFFYSVKLDLPDDLGPGEYRVLLGVYEWPSLDRLPVPAEVPGAEVRAMELGTVEVDR